MTIVLTASILLTIIYISLLLYYCIAWQQVPAFKPATHNSQLTTFLSVIIPARNESKNLPALLESLSGQTYPKSLFEVFIVDDHSTDDTAAIVKNYRAANIKLVSLQQFIDNKELNSYKK